jgi:hypothetical protein
MVASLIGPFELRIANVAKWPRETPYDKAGSHGMAGSRTRTLFRATDFKSVVSAYSTTIPRRSGLLLVVLDDLAAAHVYCVRILARVATGAPLA